MLSRIEWDYPQYHDSHAPYLSLTPKEYFQRNCWAAVEGSEPEITATAGLIGADHMCISTDYPHFDSNFPNVAKNLLKNVSREIAADIFMSGAHLYGFTDEHFAKADASTPRIPPPGASSPLCTSLWWLMRPLARIPLLRPIITRLTKNRSDSILRRPCRTMRSPHISTGMSLHWKATRPMWH